MTPRRFYLLKMHAALAACEGGLAAAWRSKHDALPGTLLSPDVLTPALAEALCATIEDVDGASVEELLALGVPYGEAEAAIASVPEP